MKNRRLLIPLLCAGIALIPALRSVRANDLEGGAVLPPALAGAFQKNISVNLQGLDAKSALGLLSEQVGLPIMVGTNVTGKITYVGNDIPVKQAFDELCEQNGLVYMIENGTVVIRSANGGDTTTAGSVKAMPLKYANGQEILPKVTQLLAKGDKVIFDDTTNSLVFVGNPDDFDRFSQIVSVFDQDPKQILISGLIVETTESFLQNIGFSYNPTSGTSVSTSAPSPNFALSAATVAGHYLNLQLQAAESRGDAKVISRPKVVTLNNKAAKINSGLTLSVKTLSNVQSAQPGQPPVAVAGGLSQINAGLTVSITPTVVGDGRVRLLLQIDSSSPDSSEAVDGIPGVDSNSASTTVIVDNDRTAIIAGLIKQTKSRTHDGVPFLMDIPILGGLFRSDNKQDENDELAIFITPSILKEADAKFYPDKIPSPRQLLDNVGDARKIRQDSDSLGAPAPQRALASPADPTVPVTANLPK